MKRNIISFIVSVLFIITVLMSRKADCMAADAFPTSTPVINNGQTGGSVQADYTDESKFITSGSFIYRVIDETKKEIEIRGINTSEAKLAIPETIDGYKVVSLGYNSFMNSDEIVYSTLRIQGTCIDNVNELVIPEGVKVIGIGAFSDFTGLKSVSLPESIIYIQPGAFMNCTSLNNIALPSGTMVQTDAFRGCTSLKDITVNGSYLGESVFEGDIDIIRIAAGGNGQVRIGSAISGSNVKKIVSDENMKLISFKDVDSINNEVKSLIVNGKKTKVESGGEGTDTSGSIKYGMLYTVPGAKCISWAKKEKVSYTVKDVKKVKKVTCAKKNNTYTYSWDKTDTTEKTYKYKKAQKKWSETDKNIRTKYNVYGKNKKGSKYKLITQTAKTSIKTKYKYIKIEPDYRWQ